MTAKQLLAIKPGDRVWVGYGETLRSSGVKTVVRITRTQVVIDWNGGGYLLRFQRENGYRIGGPRFPWSRITDVASSAECAEWDLEQKEKVEAKELLAQKEQQRLDKQAELSALFPGYSVCVEIGRDCGLAQLNLYGLSQSQIRDIAKKLAVKP